MLVDYIKWKTYFNKLHKGEIVAVLEEFAKKQKLSFFESGTERFPDLTIAFLIVEESNMILVRDALRPKRGEWVED